MSKRVHLSRLAAALCLTGALVLAGSGFASAADRGHRGGGHNGGGHKGGGHYSGGHNRGGGHNYGNRSHGGRHNRHRGRHYRRGGGYSFGFGAPFGYGGYGGYYSFGYSGHHGGDAFAGAALGLGLGYLLFNNRYRNRYREQVVVVERQVVKQVQQAPEPSYPCLQTREYQATVTIAGEEVDAYGTACLQPDGSWRHGPAQLVPQFD